MGKVLNFELEYREKGEKKILNLTIDFVSNWCVDEFSAISAAASVVKARWNKISDLTTEIAALNIERPDGYKEQVHERKAQIDALTKSILEYSNGSFFTRRFELVKTILEDNGVKDEKFLSSDFWNKNVEPDKLISFLDAVIYKDIDKKKVH